MTAKLGKDTRALPHASGHRLALFDVDRTLVRGSSLVPLGRALVEHGVVSVRTLAAEAGRNAAFARRGAGDRSVDNLRRRLLAIAAGADHSQVAAVARSVGRELMTVTYPTARWIVDRHLEAGHFCVLVSASPQELVESFAAVLGVHRAVGTRVAVVDGRVTGELTGAFCYGRGKLDRLRDDLGDVELASASAYADSASDVPLLESCGRPVAVNPDRRLARTAAARRWPVIRFG